MTEARSSLSANNCKVEGGLPHPLGSARQGDRVNFAISSRSATSVSLCLFEAGASDSFLSIALDPAEHKTGDIWHATVVGLPSSVEYGYRVTSAATSSEVLLLDPYARRVVSSGHWGDAGDVAHLRSGAYPCRCVVGAEGAFDWEGVGSPRHAMEELIIYEMHVRGFTRDASSGVASAGTFLGVVEKIPHLLELGINAVELLPIFEFNELEYERVNPETQERLTNYWGYSTHQFFCPMNRYAAGSDAVTEFKTMVRELHRHGIEVILDVVYNHTGEGELDKTPSSFLGLDKEVYYILDDEGKPHNFSGCGNTFNGNHPITQEVILESLRYWAQEMHVDGFRFDLASTFSRDTRGTPMAHAPLITAIASDPALAATKLIAEAWDATGLHQVGAFANESPRWAEWNGCYRDDVRCFIKGTPGMSGAFATRLCGSDDLYGPKRTPSHSVNFVTAHDGFSLADLVSYNHKHNLANGEDNRDGNDANDSWNCGEEGASTDPAVVHLRQRQKRNFVLALMLSQGVPMIVMGDEYSHTKHGNNNTWCQDSALNWFLWDELSTNAAFYRFTKLMIQFRRRHPTLKRNAFLTEDDIHWHGLTPNAPDWDFENRFVAFSLQGNGDGNELYAAFNACHHLVTVALPAGRRWRWVVNTANEPPSDILEEPYPTLTLTTVRMAPNSAILLTRPE